MYGPDHMSRQSPLVFIMAAGLGTRMKSETSKVLHKIAGRPMLHWVVTAARSAGAERVVDLFHALTEHLPPAVDVMIEDVREGRSWSGANVALPDVRDAIARLKVPLALHGGVELSVFTAEDQLTLNRHLELWAFGRSDHWSYVLRGKGLEERARLRPRSWRLRPEQFPAAPDLAAALEQTADRLALIPA